MLSSLFTLYGFSTLKQELKQLESARLLLTNWEATSLQTLIGAEAEVRLLNQLQQKRIAAEFSQWLASKVDVKASINSQPGQNIIHLNSGDHSYVIHGSATLSPIGLGEVRSETLQMNMGLSDSESTKQLLSWFDTVWSDASSVRNIKTELISKLDYIAADQPAKPVHFIVVNINFIV